MKWCYLPILLCYIIQQNLTLSQPVNDSANRKNETIATLSRESDLVQFNGILNKRIHTIVSSFNPPLKNSWSNDNVFSYSSSFLANMKDTIWLCLNEYDEHNSSDFCFPMKKIRVNSRYGPRSGRYHNGIDLNLRVGDTIYAMFSGKVRYAKFNTGGFGNLVILRHFNSLETFYAHLSKFLVNPNDWVAVGQPIALGGNTGRSTGPHLHLEVRFYEAAINPEEIIDFENLTLRKENLFLHKQLFRPGAKPSNEIEGIAFNQVANFKDTISNMNNTEHENPIVRPVIKVPKKKYHQIISGDTLTKIAKKYATTVANLCKLNGISVTSNLVVGRNLRVK